MTVDHLNRHRRWLLLFSLLLSLAGYFGPWIDHPVAGLVITGLDLAEVVKFLPAVRSGALTLWREGFYLPLLAVSLTSSLLAFRRELGYGWPLRGFLLLVAGVAALNMLPPAWSPGLLLTPEFRTQTAAMALCFAALLFSPFWALLPQGVTGSLVAILQLAAVVWPVAGFLRLLPQFSLLYNHPQTPGWGMGAMVAGLLSTLVLTVVPPLARRFARPHQMDVREGEMDATGRNE